ncbi:MAG: mechanosensitive ion channel domain-containing protein [Crocinitomicaceae bacterium]
MNETINNIDLLKAPNFNQIGSIQINTLILLMTFAALIFGFFFVFKKYIAPFLGSRRAVKKASILTFRLEVLIWGLFAVFAVYQLLTDSFYITISILILVILAGRNFWRDLFAGIAFKIENKFEINDPVKFGDFVGVLEKISTRNIQIKTENEELVLIPFRKLSNAVFIKRQAKGKLHSAKISLKIGTRSPDELLRQINNWIYQCPWAIVNDKVSAKIVSEDEILVTVYAIDLLSINKTEAYLKKRLNKVG